MYNRLVTDWIAGGTSADSEIRSSLRALRNRSRELGRNNDYVRAFLRELENNVVGQGIPFQAQVKMQRGNRLNDQLNDLIEQKWCQWTRKETCDVAGKLCFEDIERMAIRSVAESGEFFIRIVTKSFGGSKVPLALELIEADLLNDDKNGRSEFGNEIRMGVEVDEWGRAVAYHFFKKHPGDYQFGFSKIPNDRDTVRVPAEEIIALQMFERPGQTRAVPWLASALTRIRHMQGYEEAEIIAARATASLMGFIESPEGELQGETVIDGERVTGFDPGSWHYLAPGEKVTIPNLGRPSGQFDPFVRIMLRGLASSVGVSYESISSDFSQTNYSSSRQALLKERDYYRVLQRWIVSNFHQRIFERWLDLAVLSGELSLPQYELDPAKYQNVKWMPRGWGWVDPVREVNAYKDAIRGGLTTMSEVVAQSGGDIDELMRQRSREIDLAKSLGLIFDTDAEFDLKQASGDQSGGNSPDVTENQASS